MSGRHLENFVVRIPIPNMQRARRFHRDLALGAAIFAPVFLYCLYGAARSHLTIPHRHKPGFAIYSGPAAWALVFAITCLWLGVSIRIGLFDIQDPKARIRFALALLLLGVASLYGSGFLPTITHAA